MTNLWTRVRREAMVLGGLYLPISLTNMVTWGASVTDQMFVGHLGVDELAAAALGNVWYNLHFLFIMGLGSAQNTLASQAFGRGDKHGVKVWTVRTTVLLLAAALPLAGTLCLGGLVAKHVLGQSDAISDMVTRFCVRLAPGMFAQLLFFVQSQHWQVQGVVWPQVLVGVLLNALNALFNVLFIFWLGMGFNGSPTATTVTRFIALALMTAYSAYKLASDAKVAARAGEGEDAGRSASAGAYDSAEEFKEGERGDGASVVGAEGRREAGLVVESSGLSTRDVEADEGVCSAEPRASLFRDVFRCHPTLIFFRLAIPGGLMLCLEASAFEFSNALASQLGTVALDASSSMFVVISFTYVGAPLAMATAISIRVGNLVGAKQAKQAKWVARARTRPRAPAHAPHPLQRPLLAPGSPLACASCSAARCRSCSRSRSWRCATSWGRCSAATTR